MLEGGSTGLIVNVAAADVPVVVVTVTLAVPAAAIIFAVTGTLSWVALTSVVVSPVPFHLTVAPDR